MNSLLLIQNDKIDKPHDSKLLRHEVSLLTKALTQADTNHLNATFCQCNYFRRSSISFARGRQQCTHSITVRSALTSAVAAAHPLTLNFDLRP